MKRIEVKLSLPVVAPLLDVMKGMADGMEHELAAPVAQADLDQEFHQAWTAELLVTQNSDVQLLLGLFDDKFFADGEIGFDEHNTDSIVRACASLRLRLRSRQLDVLGDEALETGNVDFAQLDESMRKAFSCYLFLATIQELIIQHLDSGTIES